MSKVRNTRAVEITGGMIAGFAIGLVVAAMIGGFVSWAALQKRSAELSGEYGQVTAVVVVEPLRAGEPVSASQLAKRPVPKLVVSDNTMSPDEVNDVLGKSPTIGFRKGDLLLRSAFGLEPRAQAADGQAPAP